MPTAVLPDDRLTHPLEQLRGTVRRFVLIDALLSAGLFAVLGFALGLALDFGLFKLTAFDWVLDAPWLARAVVLAGLVALLVTFVIRLIQRLNKQFSYSALALVLERRFPAVLGDKLITAVELADLPAQRRYGFSEEMIRATVEEARERVATVPVETVFDWPRLRRKGILLASLAVGLLIAAYIGYRLLDPKPSSQAFARQTGDVASIWAERNLLLFDTPWPRQAHLELLGFPGEELRVGKDAAAPRVRARAFKWVIADRSARDGWRPLLWADLTDRLIGSKVPALPANLPPDAAGWDVDRIEASAGKDDALKPLFARLDDATTRPRMSRTLRKLEIPDAVSLSYTGAKTSGGLSLTREGTNEFAGEVSGLKESVRFTVRAADFRTAPRSITLVPPPQFARLTRTEYHPAYLYHPPSVGSGGKPDFATLKGLRQAIAEKDLSLTGDRSEFTLVKGGEFVLAGIADKPLKSVSVRPKVGKLPGLATGAPGPITLTPTDAERTAFRLGFRGDDRPTATTEFELVLTDDDDVSSSRTVIARVADDQPPTVELGVDVLRKLGNAYLVTPVARVPFLTESKVRDDHALSAVAFGFNVAQVESTLVVGVQAQALAGVWAGAPLVPGFGVVAAPLASASLTQRLTTTNDKRTASFPLPKFAEEFARLPLDTPAVLADRLTKPFDPDQARVVREVRFNNQDLDYLDLKLALPTLAVADPAAVQPRYRVEVVLEATDANVETGPRTGASLEPVRLLVVSEAELLAEMSKDEEAQSARLDDVLKRLRDAQGKLSQTIDRLNAPNPPADLLVTASIRSTDIAQDIAKARDLAGGVVGEFRRLHREATFNVLRPEILDRYQKEIIAPLDAILEQTFPAAEEAHKRFGQPLVENRKPDAAVGEADRTALAELLRQVAAVRAKLGEAISLNKIRDELRKLVDDEREKKTVLEKILRRLTEKLLAPEIKGVPPIELARGQKVTVKHVIDWKAFAGDKFSVRFQGPDTLKFPAELPVSDDNDVVQYDLTAGDKPGEYTLKLVPSVGEPVEVRVTVK